MMPSKSLFLLLLSWETLTVLVHGIVPPKTPVLTGFEPAAVTTYRELVCDASQPDAGTITYKWYKYSTSKGVENWERRGAIGEGQKYIFNPVAVKQMFHLGQEVSEHVSGKYKCRASNSAKTIDSEWGDLYVYTRCALYTVGVSPAKLVIGSTFTVNCYIPNPSGFSVQWTKRTHASSTVTDVAVANNKGCHAPTNTRHTWSSCIPPSLSSKTNTFNLQVTKAGTYDVGYWTCTDIGLSCISDPVKVVLQAPPGTPRITGFPTGPVAAGTQVNLKSVASPPGDTYDWYKDGTKLSTSLTYDFIVKKESTGVYTCVARNSAGSATSSNKTLIVYTKSDSVVVSSGKTSCHAGETERFTCTATGGSPTPNVTLYIQRPGKTPVKATQGHDKVMVKEDNQAEYYCEAKVDGYPSFDMTSTRKTYNVTFPNTNVSFINNPTADVRVGQVKTFTCKTDGSNPVAIIKWYQHIRDPWQNVTSGITSSERNGTYGGKIKISEWSVTATKAMTSATVRCTSEYHLAGQTFNSPNVDTVMAVKWSATELKMVEKPNSPITAGTSVNIKCETDSSNSGSPGTISWYKNGQQITTNFISSTRSADYGTVYTSQLTVTAKKEDNQAKYECKIKDQAKFKKNVTITVHFPPSGIQLSETSITVREGESKTITCSTTSSSKPVVSGVSVKKKLGSTDVDVTGTSKVTDGAYYGNNVSIDIKLDTNRKDDGAQYICSFTYGSTSFTKTATVNVQWSVTKLHMVEKPKLPISAGTNISIKCETDSSNSGSPGTISWYRNGQQITTGVTPSTRSATDAGIIYISQLTVTTRKADNQAKYECKINDQANFKKDVNITVHFPNTKVSFINNQTAVAQVGQVKTFTCETDESNPVASLKWNQQNIGGLWHNGIPGNTISERNGVYGGKIRISKWSVTATKAMKGGKVRCISTYSLTGHVFTAHVDTVINVKWNVTELKMVEKPNSPITVGTSVNIKCETDSSNSGSPGTISWYRNGQNITTGVTPSTKPATDGGTIYISQLTVTARKEDNQAKYECKIKDQANFKKNVTITVHFPPSGIQLSETNITIKEGESKAITCRTTSSSNPVVSGVSVKKRLDSIEVIAANVTSRVTDGAYYGEDVSIDITLDHNRKDNGAQYICSFKYGSAPFTKTATVNVQWSVTELKMVDKPTSPIAAGTSVNIKCETDSSNSGFSGTISWYRNGQQITTGVTPSTKPATDGGTIYISQLTVTARKEDNQAKYECKINDETNLKKDVTTTVNFPPSGIQLSETSITVREGDSKTITCSTTSSCNPAVSGISVKKRLGSTEVGVTGTSRVTDGAYYGKDVGIDIKLDTNRKDNGAQYICSFAYGSTPFTEAATVNVQFNPSKITIQKPTKAISEGQPIKVTCKTDSANPAASIQFHRKRTGKDWVKQTSGIISEDINAPQYNGKIRKSTLTVTANRLDNQAVFECKVKDNTFEVKNMTTVTVYYPPTVKLSSNPKSVKEGENLTLTCEASGGNPTSYTYSWYYNNLKQSETSKEYNITGIKYTQSGTYKCEAINYLQDGKAENVTEIDVLYKAKWNPALPELFTVASKTEEPVKFVLHVIANPSPTNVTWAYKNGTKIGESFKAAKVNDTTYILNKTSVTIKDYGNYTVNVTNQVGFSTFVFELQQAGPPLPPCCLKMVNKTAVSVYFTFKSNFSGGSTQTFTIEQSPEGSRRKRSEWIKAAVKIPDPGFEKDVFYKVKGLTSGTKYQFRVQAVNADGSSGYNDPNNGNFLKVTTKAAPNADLDVTRKDNIVAVSWSLERVYSKIQIEYCPVKGGGPCLYHDVESPTKQGSTTIDVNKEQTYKYSLVVFDGDDKVFVSPPKPPPPPPLNYVAIGGGAGAGFLLLLIIIVIIVAVVFIKKRRAEKGNGKLVTNSNTAEGTVNVAFNDPDDIDGGMNPYADSGMNPYTDSDMNPYADSIEMAASSSSTVQVEGAPGATYAVVNKGNRKPLLGGKAKKKDATQSDSQAYADVDFSKKLKKGKGKNKPTPETGEAEKAYDVIDFSKKRKGAAQSKPDRSAEQAYDIIDFSKKKKGAAPSKPDGPDGAVYAQVNKKPPVGDEYAQVDLNKKGSKKDAVRDTSGDVYAIVNKPTKPEKLPKPGTSNDEAVYANVNSMAEGNLNGVAEGNVNGMTEDDIYEDVRDDALIKEGYKQPKTAYQVGVDGTIYSEVRIKPPKNPDVIIGKETIEDPYDSVDFTKEAPPLISNPDDPNDSGFIDLI